MKKYNFYPTLLDCFQSYLNSSEVWLEYWGNSEEPSKTEEEYEAECYRKLIDKINRVPMAWEDSEAADRGTAFNAVIDLMLNRDILNEVVKTDTINTTPVFNQIVYGQVDNCEPDERWAEIETTDEVIAIKAYYNKRQFIFPISLCKEFSTYFNGATPQVFCEATLETSKGMVNIYGYIDELMPNSIHDIKTTGKYKAGKFKNNWQHIIYPYCLHENGSPEMLFEYNVALLKETKMGLMYETFTESYNYRHERDKARLIGICEQFIDFIEEPNNRFLITDEKIFNK